MAAAKLPSAVSSISDVFRFLTRRRRRSLPAATTVTAGLRVFDRDVMRLRWLPVLLWLRNEPFVAIERRAVVAPLRAEAMPPRADAGEAPDRTSGGGRLRLRCGCLGGGRGGRCCGVRALAFVEDAPNQAKARDKSVSRVPALW